MEKSKFPDEKPNGATATDPWQTFYDSVHGEENKLFHDTPHGWIQWKGTNACIDLHCACGSHGHMDAEFLYYYKCSACGRIYALGCNIQLKLLTKEQVEYLVAEGDGFPTDTSVVDSPGISECAK